MQQGVRKNIKLHVFSNEPIWRTTHPVHGNMTLKNIALLSSPCTLVTVKWLYILYSSFVVTGQVCVTSLKFF